MTQQAQGPAESKAGLPRYAVHGLVVESELPLDAPTVADEPDLRIRMAAARAASGPPPGRLLGEIHSGDWSFWCAESPDNPDIWLLRYRDVGDVEFDRRGGSLTVTPAPSQDIGLLSVLIGGGLLALILSADSEMVLHASAVDVGGGSVLAMAGASGSGKSTLAAILCAHGARLVADDALRIVPKESCRCYLGTDTLRLRPGAEAVAASIPGAREAPTADGRTGVSPPRPGLEEALRVDALLAPRASHDAKTLQIERLSAKEGLLELVRNPRVISWHEPGPHRAYFDNANRLAATVPIYRAAIPWGPPFAPGLAAEILAAVGLAEPAAVELR